MEKKNEKKKVVLAYSGGLDTSYCLKYLKKKKKGYEFYLWLIKDLMVKPKKEPEWESKHANLTIVDRYYEKTIYLIFGNVLKITPFM
jgi:argininosuccinate synthase